MKKVVLVSGARTAVGSYGGSLKSFSAAELASVVIKEAVARAKIDPIEVDEVILGEVAQVDEDGFVGRVAILKAGLPDSVTAYSLNRQCGSGLQVIANAMMAIQTGHADLVIAAGTESLSNLPYYQYDTRWGAKMGDRKFKDGVLSILTWPLDHSHNGISAETIASRFNISRAEQDAYALRSQQLAVKAIAEGRYKEEIVPLELTDRKGNVTVIDTDEGPRSDSSLERLAKLRAAFVKDGTVTAGNSSTLNDGAAAILLMSEEKALALGLTPIAEVIDFQVSACEPEIFGYAPKYSTEQLAQKLNLDLNAIDMVEINEAFASQTLAVAKDLNLDMNKVNIYGGGISIGHPLGATGVILALKVMTEFEKTEKKDALVTMCIGGGQGISMYFKKYFG